MVVENIETYNNKIEITRNVISIDDARKILNWQKYDSYDDATIQKYIDIITELSNFTIKEFYKTLKNSNYT